MFQKQNSLSPVNDATIAYIDSLIAAEKDKIEAGGNDTKLKALLADRAQYIEETMEILKVSMDTDANFKPLHEAGVTQLVKQLYSLKHFGKNFQNVKTVTAQAHQATYRERPHRLPRNTNASKSLLHNVWGTGRPQQAPGRIPTQYPRDSGYGHPQPSQSNVLVKNASPYSTALKGSSVLRGWFNK